MVKSPSAGSRRQMILAKNVAQRPSRDKGYYLVEALVCVLIVGIISAGLADSYAKVKSFNVHSQTELQATGIAAECIDQLRTQQFSLLTNNLGVHRVPVVGPSSTGDPLFARPLLRDTQSMKYYGPNSPTYATYTADDTQNYLQVTNNQVVVTLTAGPNATVLVDVVVSWTDGTGPHTYTVDTVVAAAGLNG